MYGLFPPVVQWVQACLSILDVFALHVVKLGYITHVSMSCIDDRTVRKVVTGNVCGRDIVGRVRVSGAGKLAFVLRSTGRA